MSEVTTRFKQVRKESQVFEWEFVLMNFELNSCIKGESFSGFSSSTFSFILSQDRFRLFCQDGFIKNLLLAVLFQLAYFSTQIGAQSLDPVACEKDMNHYRGLHVNTPPIKWDPTLAAEAQAYADHLKELSLKSGSTVMIHDPDNHRLNTGENLYMRDNRVIGECKDADDAWYSEIENWDFAKAASKGGATGHFTQMVWVGTSRFGVGRVTFDSQRFAKYGNKVTLIVAKFQTPGNMAMAGKHYEWYSKNVQPLKK